MYLIYLIFSFLFGLIIGSFLNALSFRLNTGLSMNGRSKCMSCSHKLYYYDLIPVLSFAYLRGHCRYCKSRVSYQYPFVEIITGFVFLITFINSGLPISLFWWLVWSLMIVISVYDFKHKIIPNSLVFILGAISLGALFFNFNSLDLNLQNILAGPIVASPFAFLWLISGGKWMGLGDAKLSLSIGWLFGISLGVSAIILAFWIGAVCSIIILLLQKFTQGSKHLTIKSEIPFGPFIVLGAFAVYYFNIDVLGLSLIFGL